MSHLICMKGKGFIIRFIYWPRSPLIETTAQASASPSPITYKGAGQTSSSSGFEVRRWYHTDAIHSLDPYCMQNSKIQTTCIVWALDIHDNPNEHEPKVSMSIGGIPASIWILSQRVPSEILQDFWHPSSRSSMSKHSMGNGLLLVSYKRHP